jgi:glycosyltransferase involved in cell wall biosynthesis
MTSTCRIYLLTYRQPELLRRSLDSVLRQTFTRWTCEIHNDDPTDTFPQKLAQDCGDPRLKVVNHKENLGPAKAFNLPFQPVSEEYVTMLEDDNWWEPTFLERAIAAMEEFPTIRVAGINARRWQEEADGSWTDLGTFVPPDRGTQLIYWPNKHGVLGNNVGSVGFLVRGAGIADYFIPEETEFSVTESVRERAFPHPILYIAEPLANLSYRGTTSRGGDPLAATLDSVLLAASLFQYVPFKEATLREIWRGLATKNRDSWFRFLFAELICPKVHAITRFATVSQRAIFILYCLRHPRLFAAVLRSRKIHSQVWSYLLRHTEKRMVEARAAGLASL